MTALAVRDLSAAFGGLSVISDLSFSVDEGERLVLFGPNGAGKTTLFNAISGFCKSTRGSIELFGKDVTDLGVADRVGLGLGRTFQVTTLFPELSVLESTMLALQASTPSRFAMFRPMMSYSAFRAEAIRLLADWGIRDRENVLTKNLSYGEQRQIEIVLALARKPRLLLLDEPAAGMSIAETEIIETMIKEMSRDVTVLLIEHDVEMAMRLADRMIVLHNGRFVASGSPQEIHSDPEIAKIYFGEQYA
jgi:branched-chain amino acid transport system ATP-binding protein